MPMHSDNSNLEKLDKELKYLRRYGVRVGVFGKKAEKEQDGITIKEYATYLIMGTIFMKPRDFLGKATRSKESEKAIRSEVRKVLDDVIKLKITGKQALSQIGIFIQQRVKEAILSNDFEPLKPYTIQKKGRNKNNILRENDFLLNSITFETVKI